MTLSLAIGIAGAAAALAIVALVVAMRASQETQRLRKRLEMMELLPPATAGVAQVEPLAASEPSTGVPLILPENDAEAPETSAVQGVAGSQTAEVPEPPRNVESTIGLTWTTRVGGLLLLAGVVYFFKYAVDRSWLGPWARVAAGAGAGVVCLALAAWLRRRASPSYVHVLAGVGLAILLASVWASHALYGLVPPIGAFAAFTVLVVAGGAAAAALDSEALLATAVIGAFANPILLAPELGSSSIRLVYPAVVAVAALVVSTPRRWSVAATSALAGGALLIGVWRYVAWEATGNPGAPGLEFAGFGVWALAVGVGIARWQDDTARTWLLVTLGVAAEAGLAAYLGPAPTPVLVAAFAGLVGVAALLRRGSESPVGLALLLAAAAIMALGAWEFGAPAGAMVAIGIWALVHVADATIASLRTPPTRETDPETTAPAPVWQLALAGLVFAVLAIELRGLPARGALAIGAGLTVVAYGVAGAILDRAGRTTASTVCYTLALIFLAAFAWLVAGDGWVGVAWSALAVVAASLAHSKGQGLLVVGALVLLGLALFRGIAVDWPPFDALAWVSTSGGSLLAFGAATVAVAALTRSHIRVRMGMAVRFGGLLALALWFSLGLRQIATTESAQAMWMTAGLAGFGGAVLALGFARRDVQLRWFGLGLVMATIAKLLLSDIFLMDGVARTIILITLGILLLASGFLYARFGVRLRELLQEDVQSEDARASLAEPTPAQTRTDS
ncbi:MAG: putative membrane protein [Myxococcota bacterium]|jgi:uncharacterized membrane protein